MFLTPYETTACSSYNVRDIRSQLKRAAVTGELLPAKTLKGIAIPGLLIVPSAVKNISPFTMPVDVDMGDHRIVVVDVRGSTRGGSEDEDLRIVDGAEYEGAILKGLLTKAWMDGQQRKLRQFSEISVKAFTRLVPETLVRRLGLTPFDQQAVVVCAAMFYYSNFEVGSTGAYSDRDRETMAITISRVTKISPDTVLNILSEGFPYIKDLASFCDALRFAVKSPRVEKLSPGVLLTMLGGVWYGGKAAETVGVALEYPPVWLAMIYQALTDRSYHGASLTRLVEQIDKNNAGKQFQMDMAALLESMSDE